MSDFEDEEGVDEPVLDDDYDEEGQEEEEVSCFEITACHFHAKLVFGLLKCWYKLRKCFHSFWKLVVLARLAILVTFCWIVFV